MRLPRMGGGCRELTVACAIATVTALGCATGSYVRDRPPRTVEEQIADAEQRLGEGRRDEAFRRLHDLSGELEVELRQAPRRADLHFWLGTVLHLLEDDGAALRHFEAAADDARVAALASYNAGQIHQLRREQGAALDWFLRAERAAPGDWRTAAKLVQVYQALGRTWDRDHARQKVLDLYRAGKIDPAEFCREQFQEGRLAVRAFERFELSGEWAARYRFEVSEAASGAPVRLVSLGSYQVTTGLARLHGAISDDERLFHLDGYVPGGEHETYAFFAREPAYEEVRERVLQTVRNASPPISRTIPGDGEGSLRVMPATLLIDPHGDKDYVSRTFAEILQLAPSASMDPSNRITVTGVIRQEDAGTVLVATLAGSARTITISPWSYNRSRPEVKPDGANGKGTDVHVYFDPEFDPEIPTLGRDGRVRARRGRPAFIGLGHELIHALHFVTGTRAGRVGPDGRLKLTMDPYSFKDERGVRISARADLEDLNTIGLGGHRNGPTENDLRRVHGVPLRGAVSLPKGGRSP